MTPPAPIIDLRVLVHPDGTRILQYANGGLGGWMDVPVVVMPKPISNMFDQPGDRESE